MAYLKAPDVISGQEGMAYMTINGENKMMFYVKTLEANLEKEKDEIKTLGKRLTQHKLKGMKGSGSFTAYMVTSTFAEMAEKYSKDGVDQYFDIRVVNDDPSSGIGRQSVLLKSCNIDTYPITKLDVEASALEFDLNFTFDDVVVLESFSEPELG